MAVKLIRLGRVPGLVEQGDRAPPRHGPTGALAFLGANTRPDAQSGVCAAITGWSWVIDALGGYLLGNAPQEDDRDGDEARPHRGDAARN